MRMTELHPAKDYAGQRRKHRIWKRIVAGLACVVVFSTTYMLILPAVTEEEPTFCGIEEHRHDANCYEQQLVCPLEETPPHVHSETCYEQRETLICGQEETEGGHIHSSECYQTEEVLVCGQEENEGHTHTEQCYEDVLVCEKEEHTHTLACFSNPNADIETQAMWESTFSDVQLSGIWADDVLAIAKSQLGYKESTQNYVVTEDGQKKGWTRYGAWYGDAYGDWDAMFAAFCLQYAGVQGYPADADCSTWVGLLRTAPYDYFRSRIDYTPKPGDLIFFDKDRDGDTDHMGIVASMDSDAFTVCTIEGGITGMVQYGAYAADDPMISGYGIVPPETPEEAKADQSDSDISVMALQPVEAPDYIGSIPTTNNTGWQITKEQYTGREQSNKTAFDGDNDGKADIYLQKNMVPTDTENEFLVYLSMDKKMTMETFFNESTFGVTVSKGYNPGDTESGSIKGNHTDVGAHGETGNHAYYVKIHLYQHRGDTTPIYSYIDTRYGSSPNASNGSLYMKCAGMSNYLILQTGITLKTDGNGQGSLMEANVYLDALNVDFSLYDSVFQQVTDIMGDYIEFLEIKQCDGTATFDKASNTLLWQPVDNAAVISAPQSGTPVTGWRNNICQLVYRVRLRTEQDEFRSCASTLSSKAASIQAGESYAVNQSATLQFYMSPISGAAGENSEIIFATYPVPEVRGLLYDITFDKQTDSSRSLGGAEFGLYQADGITPVYQADGTPYTITTVKGETTQFTDLPCGTYVLKEISPPPHYSAAETAVWTIQLNYTENSAVLAQNSLHQSNLRYTGNDRNGQWIIVNTRNEYTYQIKILKTDDSGKVFLQNAAFSVTNPMDRTQVLDGTTDKNGSIAFNASFKPNIEYVLDETAAPDGYNLLPAAIRFVVKDDLETDTQTVELVNADELNELVQLNLSEENGNATLTIQVVNQAGYELPKTGGPGTFLFTLCGLSLMAGALMYRCLIHRKRERRAERS